MKKHILLEKAFKYTEPIHTPTPEGYSFNTSKGYWVDNDGSAMMMSNAMNLPQTKKCDRETGEDQKGE